MGSTVTNDGPVVICTLMNKPIRSEPPKKTKITRPPPPRHESWVDWLQECQDGAWWLVRTYELRRSAISIASHLRIGVKPTPPGEWEFRTGPTDDGQYGVWARRTDVPQVESKGRGRG